MTFPQSSDPQNSPAWNNGPASGYADVSTPTPPPGRGLSIVGFVLAFLVAPVGLILSIIAAVKLGRAGAPKGLAIAGIIISIIVTIFVVIGIVTFSTVLVGVLETCAELGPGVWEVDGVDVTCS